MEKIVIFDWGGVVESHENNFEELKEAKIQTIKEYNKTASDQEILTNWPNYTPKGNQICTVNDENELREWIKTIQKKFNMNLSYEDFKSLYEEKSSNIKY